MSVSQRVSYLASARDDGANISCTSTQTETGDMIHFTQRRSIQLRIVPVTALKSKLSENVGVLTMILMSILLIILLMVLLTMLGLRRRRNPKDQKVKSVDLLKPVWSVKDQESQGSGCVRHAELYEPLNVSFIDLYHTAPPDTKISQTWHKSTDKTIHSNSSIFSSKDGGKDDSSGLGSSSTSDSLCIAADIEMDTKYCAAYTETHFEHSSSSSHPPPSRPSHHPYCPWPPYTGEVHLLDPSHSTPLTLIRCQRKCFHPAPSQ